jgi:hypothetical protein
VDAKTFLREARWVVETRKAAIAEMQGSYDRYAAYFRSAHGERFQAEAGGGVGSVVDPRTGKIISRAVGRLPAMQIATHLPAQRPAQLSKQAQVDWLLATRTAPKLNDIYRIVYQDILGERVSNLPVLER